MYFGWMDLYVWSRAWAWVSWGHTTQISGWRKEQDRAKEGQEVGGKARWQGRTVTNRGLILEDRGLPHLVISHTCSENGSDHPWRKTRAQRNTGRRKDKTKKKRQKDKSTGFRSLGANLKEEKENYCVDFSMKKKSVYLIIESFRIKRQSRKLPKPFSGTHQLQRKVHTHTHTQTLLHTKPTHTWTCGHRSSRNPKPKIIKTVRLAHPQQQRTKQFYIADRNQKEILARLSKVVPTKKYKQWSKIYKFTWCHIGAG